MRKIRGTCAALAAVVAAHVWGATEAERALGVPAKYEAAIEAAWESGR